jgi:hypothetical protein
MIPKKRLQVFVSSTYTDLRHERQAAVEAILMAGHIPAGMELFAAGDQSQMDVIRRWIDESDAYMLLLGGRYGSVEPASGKSYTQLEYEHAVARGMPLFALVITDDHLDARVRQHGPAMLEREHPQKLREFGALVTSRMVRFWGSTDQIKLGVYESLAEISRRDGLRGWVPGDQAVDSAVIAEQIAQLTKENAELRAQLAEMSAAAHEFVGASFDEMYELLDAQPFRTTQFPDLAARLGEVATAFGDDHPTVLHAVWHYRDRLPVGTRSEETTTALAETFRQLARLGLAEVTLDASGRRLTCRLRESGSRFVVRLRLVKRRLEEGEAPEEGA